MNELTDNVNWLAVIAGTIISFLLGWLWYSPRLFGSKWAEGVGIKLDGSGPSALALVIQFIATFFLAWIIGVTAVANALLSAILIVLTIVCLMVAGGLFSKKSRYAIITETGFVVVMAVIMIICQGIF